MSPALASEFLTTERAGRPSSFFFFFNCWVFTVLDFPASWADIESACSAEDPGLIPGLGRSPGEGIGYPLQYSWASLVAQLVQESACSAEDRGLIPGWEDTLEEGVASHSSILSWRIPMDRGAWWAAFHGVTKSQTQLSDEAHSTAHSLYS